MTTRPGNSRIARTMTTTRAEIKKKDLVKVVAEKTHLTQQDVQSSLDGLLGKQPSGNMIKNPCNTHQTTTLGHRLFAAPHPASCLLKHDPAPATAETIINAVAKGEKVSIKGFGTFERVIRAERPGRNPQTGEPLTIPERAAPVFRAGKSFKDNVHGNDK
jgi:nucleoid DNA-binding protein